MYRKKQDRRQGESLDSVWTPLYPSHGLTLQHLLTFFEPIHPHFCLNHLHLGFCNVQNQTDISNIVNLFRKLCWQLRIIGMFLPCFYSCWLTIWDQQPLRVTIDWEISGLKCGLVLERKFKRVGGRSVKAAQGKRSSTELWVKSPRCRAHHAILVSNLSLGLVICHFFKNAICKVCPSNPNVWFYMRRGQKRQGAVSHQDPFSKGKFMLWFRGENKKFHGCVERGQARLLEPWQFTVEPKTGAMGTALSFA